MVSYINLTSFWGRGEIFWRPRRIMFPGYKLPIDSALGLPLLSKLWKIKWLKQVVVAFWWMQGWVRSGVRPFSFPDLDKFLFSHSVRSDSLQLHGLQHTKVPCLFTISWSLLKLMSIELMMASNHLILYHPLLLLVNILLIPPVFSSCLSPSLFLFSHLFLTILIWI